MLIFLMTLGLRQERAWPPDPFPANPRQTVPLERDRERFERGRKIRRAHGFLQDQGATRQGPLNA